MWEASLAAPLTRNMTFLAAVDREDERLQSIIYARTPGGLLNRTVATPQDSYDSLFRVTMRALDKHVLSIGYESERRLQPFGSVGGYRTEEAATSSSDSSQELGLRYTAFVNPRMILESSVEVEREKEITSSVTGGRRIVVPEAFTAGGAQADSSERSTDVGIRQLVSLSLDKHLIRIGLQVPHWTSETYNDRSNFGGTYYFATLDDYVSGRPYSFIQQRGNPSLTVRGKAGAFFVQDTWQARPNLTVGAGLRYQRQNYINDGWNFAPRLSVAWGIGKNRRHLLRVGAGVFYDRVRSGTVREVLRSDGTRTSTLIVSQPSYPDPISGEEVPPEAPGVVRFGARMSLPRILQHSVRWETAIKRGTTLSAGYRAQYGRKLLRSLDLNAPLPVTFVRPDPRFGMIRSLKNLGRSDTHMFDVTFRGRVPQWFSGSLQYQYRRAFSDFDSTHALPQNSYDLSLEWSRDDSDQRQRFGAMGVVSVGNLFKTGVIFSASSGRPYTVTTGRDENRDGVAIERPAGLRRNTEEGPSAIRLDVRWSRDFRITQRDGDREGLTGSLALDAFNVLNRVNYSGYVGNLSSPFFGQPTSAQAARRLQLSLRLRF